MKKYDYSSSTLWVSIILPTILVFVLFVWSLYEIITNGPTVYTQFLAIMTPAYLLLSVVGIHNPSTIIVSEESITFKGFSRSHQYSWDEVDTMMVKDYGNLGKSFIKIGRFRMFGGRYWVSSKLNGYSELIGMLQSKAQLQHQKMQQKNSPKSKQALVKN